MKASPVVSFSVGAVPLVAASVLMTAGLIAVSCGARPLEGKDMSERRLTPAEERVIVNKGTEPPFSGEYVNLDRDGTYRCRQCGAALFSSDAKFHSGCGWPAFDDALPGAVTEVPDRDGNRTEIVCSACGGHLGHVFRGEGFTPADTRHCVNSISMVFEPAAAAATGETKVKTVDYEDAYFAGGCFWGVEYWFDREPGVVSAVSGYMGGPLANPTYGQVKTGGTGHAEAVHVVFDPRVTSYEKLAKLFFEIHDPTQINRQGPDVGHQYRSAVYYSNDAQRTTIEGLVQELKLKGLDVATELAPAGTFWPAEDYHQDYYEHKGSQPYCHSRVRRFD